ncbi:MAG TPA: uroporphyrinogen decarboxylase family protein [bacterium]|nr:uroporphyrinogen decarboxylase family protein [bacterium]HPP30391.1 uroporphyrinogen decarboxylase family protein [bacterium]
MNTEERVLTALRCEQPDRVPVFIYLNPWVENSIFFNEPSYSELMNACREYADAIYIWYSTPFFETAAALQREERTLENGNIEHIIYTPKGPLTSITGPGGRGTRKRWISTPEDAERILSIPYEPYRPDLTEYFQTRQRLKDKCVTQVVFNDPICIAAYIDEETLAFWTLEQRPLLKRMLDVVYERLVDHLRYYLENGAGPLFQFDGPEFALPPLMSPADFEEFVVAYDKRIIDLIHSYPDRYVIVHSHGKVSRFLETFAGMGMDGLNVLEPPPIGDTVLSDAKKRIGDRVCLIGNIQYDDIARGTEADIERLVADAIAQAGPGGGFILSPCAAPYECPLPQRTSHNLIHYLKMGRKYGQY